jgi:U3 small nucleolar RNA-associated protein 22
MFKMRVEEMLIKIRPSYGNREAPAEAMLKSIKTVIEAIPEQEPIAIPQAEKTMLKRKIVIPFPSPPPADAQYKLGFSKPASVNVTGSYALKTAVRQDGVLTLDLVITMPTTLFTEKDYLDNRYFHKRAYYLACIASALRSNKELNVNVKFSQLSGNFLQPVLLVQSEPDTDFAKSECQIQIIFALPEAFFALPRTAPNKCCVRSGALDDKASSKSTPFYNSTLRADNAVTSYLKLLHGSGVQCAGYRDACLLGRVWMEKRRLSSTISKGGFGHFEWAALVALLLQGGGPRGKAALLSTYDGYQLFRATLVFLASKDLVKQPLSVGNDEAAVKIPGQPMLFDAARGVNLLYKMTSASYKDLQRHAQTTIKMLSGRANGQFESTFVSRVSEPLLQYDLVGELKITEEMAQKMRRRNDHPGVAQPVFDLLAQGLGNRVSMINVSSSLSPPWPVDSSRSKQASRDILIGLQLDPNNASRTVERGPPAEEAQAAATFREFWGDNAQLRRFKDGSILESVVWKTTDSLTLTRDIMSYVLEKHLLASCIFTVSTAKKQVQGLQTSSSTFEQLLAAYRTFETDIRALEGLPLSTRQFQATSPLLRSASIVIPFSVEYSRENPASVVLQFEGSGRWPDDLQAIQMTKIAFLLRIDYLLTTAQPNVTSKIGLENTDNPDSILNRSFLDIIYPSGASFRLRIHHEREQTLLERRLADKTGALSAKDREETAGALAAYKRDFVLTPLHTQAMQILCTRHPAFSGSVRLTKAWFNAHLLGNHLPAELIEIIVARTFLQPYPWQTPSTPQTGFLRTLHFLSTWDWRVDPLIVDFSAGDMKSVDLEATRTRFEAWRKLDPLMNRVVLFAATNYAQEGTTWSEHAPSKVVAGRMSALARAAMQAVSEQGAECDLDALFKSPLKDFDFVIYIASKFGKKPKTVSKSKYKNLQAAAATEPDMVGYDAARLYCEELQRLFGDSAILFHEAQGGDLIAGLWSPHTSKRKWKINLGYSSIPVSVKKEDDSDVDVELNRDAMLSEMARLGGHIIARVERNR